MARFKNIQFNMNSIPDLANLKKSKNSSLYLFNSSEIGSMIETSTILKSLDFIEGTEKAEENEERENMELEQHINFKGGDQEYRKKYNCKNEGELSESLDSSTANIYNLLQNLKKLKKRPEVTLSKHSKLVTQANRYMMEKKILRATKRYRQDHQDKIGGE